MNEDTSYTNGERATKMHIDGFTPVEPTSTITVSNSNLKIAYSSPIQWMEIRNPHRALVSISADQQITYPDDLTLDEAKYCIEQLLRHPLHSAPSPQRVTLTSSKATT